MWKDGFEGLLKIDSLKEISTSFLADAASKSNSDTCTQDSQVTESSESSAMQEDGSSPSQVSCGDIICNETSNT